MGKPLEALHKSLLKNNFDVPEKYEDFEYTLSLPGDEGYKNRHALWQSMRDNNFDVPDNYDDFRSTLFEVKENKKPQQNKMVSNTVNTPDGMTYTAAGLDSLDKGYNPVVTGQPKQGFSQPIDLTRPQEYQIPTPFKDEAEDAKRLAQSPGLNKTWAESQQEAASRAMNPEPTADNFAYRMEGWKQAEEIDNARKMKRGEFDSKNFADFYQKHVAPVFGAEREAAAKQAQEETSRIYQEPKGGYNTAFADAFRTAVAYEKNTDPEKIANKTLAKVQDDDAFGDYVLQRMGISSNATTDNNTESEQLSEREKKFMKLLFQRETGEVADQIIQKIYDQYKKEGAPQSVLGYIGSKAFHENFMSSLYLAMVRRAANSSGIREQLRAMASEEYGEQAGWLTRMAGGAAPFAVDLATGGFSVPSAVGQALVKGGARLAAKQVAKQMEKRAVARGLKDAALKAAASGSEEVAERYLATQAPIVNLMLRSAGSAANFATYDVQSEAVRQLAEGKFDGANLLKQAAHGAALGGVMGVTGGLISNATRNSGLTKKVLADIGGIGAEAGIFAAANGIQKVIDLGIDITDVDWADTTGEALGMVVGMKAAGAAIHPKTLLNRYRQSKDLGMQLNSHDLEELKAAGYNFDNIIKGLGEFGKITPQNATIKRDAAEYTIDPSGKREQKNTETTEAYIDEEAFNAILNNPEISSSLKRKLTFIATGKVLSLEPVFGADINIDDATGKATIITKNVYGNPIETKEYKSKEEAQKEFEILQEAALTNTIGGLERIAEHVGFDDVMDAAKGRTKEETGVDVDNVDQLADLSKEEVNSVLSSYVKNLQDAYMQRFNEGMERIGEADTNDLGIDQAQREERRQAAYDKGAAVLNDESQFSNINYDKMMAEARLMQQMPDEDQRAAFIRQQIMQAVESGSVADGESILAQYSSELSDSQRDAVESYLDSYETATGVDDAFRQNVQQYSDLMHDVYSTVAAPNGMVTPLNMKDGTIAYYQSGDLNGYHSSVFVKTQNNEIKQVSSNDIASVGETVSADELATKDIEKYVTDLSTRYQMLSDGSMLLDGQEADIVMGNQLFHVTALGGDGQGNTIVQMEDGSRMTMSPEQLQEAVTAANSYKIQNILQQEQAEAIQQQREERFANDIVGYTEGQPDLMAKDTKPEAAAEYLLSQTNADGTPIERSQVLQNIQNEIENNITKQQESLAAIQQARNDMAMYDEGDINYQEAELKVRMLEPFIEDMKAQQRKWGEIRQAIMTDEERQAFERERINLINKSKSQSQKETAKVEARQEVPTVEDIASKYENRSDAEAYIEEQRKLLAQQYRDEVYPRYDDIQKQLSDYQHGLTSPTVDEITALTDEQAILGAQMSMMVDEQNKWKKLASSISRVYNAREREELTPQEIILNKLAAETDKTKKIQLAQEAFKDDADALAMLDNLEPQDVYEYIAENLGKGSINWEGLQRGEHKVRGLISELGEDKRRGVGAGFDTNGFNYFLAPTGQGKGIDEIVHDIAEGSPYSTEEVKNALISMLQDAQKPTDISNRIINDRIAQAEQLYNENLERERQAELDAANEINTNDVNKAASEAEKDVTLQQANESFKATVDEVAKEIDLCPSINVNTESDLQQLKDAGVSEQYLNKVRTDIADDDTVGRFMPELGMILFYPEKMQRLGMSPLEKKANVYHENVHALSRKGYTKEDFAETARLLNEEYIMDNVLQKHQDKSKEVQNEEVVSYFIEGIVNGGPVESFLNGTFSEASPELNERLNEISKILRNEERQELPVHSGLELGGDKETSAGQPAESGNETGESRERRVESIDSKLDAFRKKNPDRTFIVHYGEKESEGPWEVRGKDADLVGELMNIPVEHDANGVAVIPIEDNETLDNTLKTLISNGHKAGVVSELKQDNQNPKITETVSPLKDVIQIDSNPNYSEEESEKTTQTTRDTLEKDVFENYGGKYLEDGVIKDGDYYHVGNKVQFYKDGRAISGEIVGWNPDDKTFTVRVKVPSYMSSSEPYTDYTIFPLHIKRYDEKEVLFVDEDGKEHKGMLIADDGKFKTYREWTDKRNLKYVDYKVNYNEATQDDTFSARLAKAKDETNINPTEDQKKAGNYKMDHISFGGYRMSIENPKGSTRSGVDANGKSWSIEMKDSYGYIGEKYGADGDHLDFFINDDADLDNFNGRVYVVDQKNEDGTFDESKVMYGYPTWSAARKAYERNYEPGWWEKRVMAMTGLRKENFDEWLKESDHKRKPFADYVRVKSGDTVTNPMEQLMADVEDRSSIEKPAEAVSPSESFDKMTIDELKQQRKKKRQALGTSRVLLGTTSVRPGSLKERTLKQNIAQAEADIAAIDKTLAEKQAEMKARIEQQEIGDAMVDQLENMGFDVTADTAEMRRVRKQAEKDNSEAGKLRHFETADGQIYGFTYKGKMYLDPRKIDAELPIHEYAHPWCEAFRKLNPDGWKDIVDLMKGDKDTWEFVKQLNPDLTDENDIAEEMIAKFSGKKGQEHAEAEYKRMNAKDSDYKSKWGNIWQNISKAIQDFWKKVGDFLYIKYESTEQVYDQVVRDFANKINPRKRVENWLKERDKDYLKAVESGDDTKAKQLFDEALRENIGNGITPYVTAGGYRGKLQHLAHGVKSRDAKVIAEVADMMAPLIPKDAVLIPAPSHTGEATDMLDLAQAISERTGAPVADVLKSEERGSQYEAKKIGKAMSSTELGISKQGELPEDKIPVVIDNVVDSGNTAEACVQALGKGIVASLAGTTDGRKHVSSLKSAEPVVTDKKGNVIPLSDRFEFMVEGNLFGDEDFEEPAAIMPLQRINEYGLNENSPMGLKLSRFKDEYGNEVTLAGYVDSETGDYVFLGKDADDVIKLVKIQPGYVGEQDGMTSVRLTEQNRDVILPKLVANGYKMAFIPDSTEDTEPRKGKVEEPKPATANNADTLLKEVERRKEVAKDKKTAEGTVNEYFSKKPKTEDKRVRQLATKAVLKSMTNAGVPYKVVNKKEEKQMMQIFSMMNQEVIKQFARSLRGSVPHSSMEKYIVYNMNDPYGIPVFAEKLSVANFEQEQLQRMAPEGTWQIIYIGLSGEEQQSNFLKKAAEMNVGDLQAMTVWHGSGAKFDAFDHRYMSSGEGTQSYGYGTYVTEVEGIGRLYAENMGDRHQPATYKGVPARSIIGMSKNEYQKLGATNEEQRDILASIVGSCNFGYGDPVAMIRVKRNSLQELLERKQAIIEDTKEQIHEDNITDESLLARLNNRIKKNEKIVKETQEALAFVEQLNPKDFKGWSKPAGHYLYKVDIPEDTGDNYFDWETKVPENRADEILADLRTQLLADDKYGWKGNEDRLDKQLEDMKSFFGNPFYWRMATMLGNSVAGAHKDGHRLASALLSKHGYVGIKYPAQYLSGGREDNAKNYVIFNESDAKITDTISFMFGDEASETPVFYSNAQHAVEAIRQEKATPEQWRAMIEKNGGLKAGEDKWLGLSDWLKEQQESGKKSLTKQEVMDYIRQNQIQVADVHYSNELSKESKDKLDELNREFSELIAEGEEATNSIYASDWAEWAYEQMVDRYGDDFRMAFDIGEGSGENSRLTPSEDFSGDLSDAARYFLDANEMPINRTRLGYTTEGLDNKKEIALVVPTIEPYRADDDIHFGDAGNGRAVAWARFGDTTIDKDNNRVYPDHDSFVLAMQAKYDGARGYALEKRMTEEERQTEESLLNGTYQTPDNVSKVCVIDEIQSKRHQDGREKGYAKLSDIRLQDEYNTIREDMVDRYGADVMSNWRELKEIEERDKPLLERAERIRAILVNEVYGQVPDAPFEKNWHELAMKRMIRYAAENGYDKLAWTTGAQQAERYNLANTVDHINVGRWGEDANGYELEGVHDTYKGPSSWKPDNEVEKSIKDYIEYCMSNGDDFLLAYGYALNQITDAPEESKGWTTEAVNKVANAIEADLKGIKDMRGVVIDLAGEGDMIGMVINRDGRIVDSSMDDFIDKSLADVVGKEIALKIINAEDKERLGADNLRIGGEGMKGFYDQILPRFVEKYCKKWGVKPTMIELPGIGQTMWSIDITPEMKESVMQGQPMFQKEGKQLMGWSDGKQVYLTQDGLNPNTPLHECTHLWDKWCQQERPDLWKQLVSAMKKTAMWEEVASNPNYRNIWNDENRMASEVHARLSGAAGEDEFMKAAFKKNTAQSIINEVKSALRRFWQAVLNLFSKHTKTLADDWQSLDAIIRMPIRDLVNQDFEKVMQTAGTATAGQVEAQRGEVIRKTLMGVHNISEDKLKKAIKLGGLANPSLAVWDTDKGIHTAYGEISLIPSSDLIDSEIGDNAGTYAGDAYTPTYPYVERMATKQGEKHIEQIAKEVAGGDKELERHLRHNLFDYVEGNSRRLHLLYLLQKGLKPEIVNERINHTKEEFDAITKIFGEPKTTMPSDLTDEQSKALVDLMVNLYEKDLRDKTTAIGDEKVEAFIKKRVEDYRNSLTDENGRIWFAKGDNFVHENWRDEQKRNNPKPDWYMTDNNADYRIAKEGLAEDYEKWKEEQLFDDADFEEKLFAGYDRNGNRKYLPNTVENASRLMNRNSDTNAYDQGGLNATKASLLKRMKTLSDIRKNKHLLQDKETYDKSQKEASDELFDVIHQLSDMQKIDDNPYSNIDYAERRLQEAITKKDPISYLNKEYGYSIDKDSEYASQVMNFIEKAKNLPAKYFETKFKRPVRLNEFAIAVVPETTSKEVVDALKAAGLEVHTYDAGNHGEEGDANRAKAVMAAVGMRDDILFHIEDDPEIIKRLDKEPKMLGYRNVVLNEDGTLGSPMANRLGRKGVGRKPTSMFEMDKWERSDENPELATEDGKIDLLKPDNKAVGGVDYNPYIHIRPNKVNKQFKQAWERPNLVYVETEYPESELTSGYQADKAKKAVGLHDWNGGELILSRWDKPVRIVPWEEVADDWVDEFKGRGVEFDIVPPALLPILAERGVEILPPHKGMGKDCQAAYEAWTKRYEVLRSKGKGKRIYPSTESLKNAEKFIAESLEGKHNGQRFEIELPQMTKRKIRAKLGKDYDSHNIFADGIRHSNKNHGVEGEKLSSNSIPLREEDFKLAPYVMTAPDRVERGSMGNDGRESIRFIKNLSNGVVLVVEKEQKSSPDDMDTITMWATLSSGVADARSNERPLRSTSQPANVVSKSNSSDANARTVISSIDAAKIRKDAEIAIENDEKIRLQLQNEKKQTADKVAEQLGGAKVNYVSGDDIVDEGLKRENENGTLGVYNPNTGEITLFLDNIEDNTEAARTVCHEKLGHEGLVALLGSQEEVNKFGTFVFKSADKDIRKRIIEKADEIDPNWKKGDRFSTAAQEVLGDIAADGPATAEEFDLLTKVKHYLISLLNKLGLKIRGLLNEKDLRYYILKTGEALKKWNQLSDEKKQELSSQSTNYDILRSAGKGKPRKRKDESQAQYFQRLKEWEKWRSARQMAKENNDPEPDELQFHKQAEAQYKADLKEWLDNNGISDSENLGAFPKRKADETPLEYAKRVADYEAQKDMWSDAPNMSDYLKKANDGYREAYTAWRERYDLQEEMNVDERIYEGDVNPTPTYTDAEIEAEALAEKELADAEGFEIDEQGAKRMAKLAVIERRKDFESANAEDAIWVYDFTKMTDEVAKNLGGDATGKELRAALPFLIEAERRKDNLDAEREVAVQELNKSKAIQDAHTFIDMDSLDKVRKEINDLENAWMNKEDNPSWLTETAYREAARELAEKLNEVHELYTGYNKLYADDVMQIRSLLLQALTSGRGEVMPDFAAKYLNVPEVEQLMQHVKNWYDEFYQVLEDAGLKGDAGYISDGYVNHVWDKEKSDPKAWEQYIENYQRTKSPNMRHREIDTYMDGMSIGLVPKYADIVDMIAHYSRQNNEAVANSHFLDDLKFLSVQEMNDAGEVTAILPLIMSDKPDAMLRDKYALYYVPGVGDIYVLKHVQKRFANVFGTMRTADTAEWLSQVGKGYDIISATAKKIQLAVSGFHALALFEVDVAQNNPVNALKHLFKYIVVDSIKAGTLPAYAHPEDFQFAAKHLVQLGATEDYAAADVNAITKTLRNYFTDLMDSDNAWKKAAGVVGSPAAIFMDWINKGFDTVLWNYLHDGLKLCAFNELAKQVNRRVEKQGLDEEMREKLLDEAGQYVNDMFGGQYFELLNVSPATLKWMRRFFLSPDWLVSTQRHFFANFGFGSIYSDGGFREYIKYNADNIKRAFGKDVEHNELRRLRSRNAKICYLIGAMFWWQLFYNAINAMYRWMDEKDEKSKAEEMRKTNPQYKSPYELAYPDGMKWYDYTMYGNTVGQQTHLFTGRYSDGTETYVRWGKQFREFPELFLGRYGLELPSPLIQRMMSKGNPNIGTAIDFFGAQNIGGFESDYENKELREKYGKNVATLAAMARHFIPFGMPTHADKEYKWLDFFMPSSKGFSRWKAKDYFETFIMDGDWNGIEATYKACVMNGIDAEASLNAAIASIKAVGRRELTDDVTDLSTAALKFDAETKPETRMTLRNRIKKYLKDADYKVMTREEAIEKVHNFLDDADVDDDKNVRYVVLATSKDIIAEEKLKDLGRKAKQYKKKIEATKGTNAYNGLRERYNSWLVIDKKVSKAIRSINKDKKRLGQLHEDEIMNNIRETIKRTQSEVDELQAPE